MGECVAKEVEGARIIDPIVQIEIVALVQMRESAVARFTLWEIIIVFFFKNRVTKKFSKNGQRKKKTAR